MCLVVEYTTPYFTPFSLFKPGELWLLRCGAIKGDMMYALPCSESHSSSQTITKMAPTPGPSLFPASFSRPVAQHVRIINDSSLL